jgi:hypothetical protein
MRRESGTYRMAAVARLTTASVAVFATLAVSAAAASTPQLVSLTQSATSVDVTTGTPTVTFTAHILNTGFSTSDLSAPSVFLGSGLNGFTAAPTSYSAPGVPGNLNNAEFNATLKLTSGNDADGVWTGTATLPAGLAGTYAIPSISLFQAVSVTNENALVDDTFASSAVAAAGAHAITTKVTAAPSAPSHITSDVAVNPNLLLGSVSSDIVGQFQWTNAGAGVSGVIVHSLSSGCGAGAAVDGAAGPGIFSVDDPGFGFCKATFGVFNSAGASPVVTSTAIF